MPRRWQCNFKRFEAGKGAAVLCKAIRLAGKKDIRLVALEDRDLEPLWKDIAEI